MGKPVVGEVVVLPFPQTDLQPGKYWLIAEEDAYFRFQVEHIISRKHGGSSDSTW
jgi:hypothetical protein